MTTSRVFILAGLWSLTACAAGPMEVSRSRRDPSNPNAAEGTPPLASTAASSATHEHSEHEHTASSETVAATYVCPMHPDVTASAPGLCPKCNMKLVPKE